MLTTINALNGDLIQECLMDKLADHNHPLVRETAEQLTQGDVSVRGRLERLFLYVRDDIRFGFPEQGDFVSASDTIRRGLGQCNTKATLLLALCRATGIPARIHFSLISKKIQKGFFTGLAYWLMPSVISHSWIEVEVDGSWRRIDTFINDKALFDAAMSELKSRGWSIGFSVALNDGAASTGLSLDEEAFQQMAAVTDDHGVWDDPSEYYASAFYKNRPSGLKMWLYRRLIGGINRRVERLRQRGAAASIEMA